MSEAGAPRRTNVWLILSICLNVVLVAMMAVGVARAWHHAHEAKFKAFSAQSIVSHLSPDKAKSVQAIIDAHRARINTLADAALGARYAARAAFTADVLDKEAYRKAQQQIRVADDALKAEKLQRTLEIAAFLSVEERRAIADRAREQDKKYPIER